MAAVVGSLRAELSANVAQFQGDMGKAAGTVDAFAKRFEAAAQRVQRIGQTLSISVTAPLVLFGYRSVKAFAEAESAAKAVEAVISTMGERAGFTAAQLGDMAKELERSTNIDADEILGKVTANLLTFGNVAGDVFERAQAAALDLSIRLGQDLQTSAIQLGKALNDPIKGLTALRRVGVSFSESQQATIKRLVELNRVAEAQGIILGELERQYGQVAEVAAGTAEGQLRGLQVQWENMEEEWGKIILEILPPLIQALQDVTKWLQSLTPETKAWVVQIGLVAAALGPLMVAIGLFAGGLKNVAWVVTTILIPALTTLARHPIILGAAAVGAGIGWLIDQFRDASAEADGLLRIMNDIQNAIRGATKADKATGDIPKTVDALAASIRGPEAIADKPVLGEDKPRVKPKVKSASTMAREAASAAADAKRDLKDLADAATDAERAVQDLGGGGLSPLADRLRDIDERFADTRASILEQIEAGRALAGSNAAAAANVARLEASLGKLAAAHVRAKGAALEQFAAEQKLADLDAQRRVMESEQRIQDLRDATSGAAQSPQVKAFVAAEQELAQARLEGARELALLEQERADAARVNDAAAVERINTLIGMQQAYNDEVDATSAAQLVAAREVRDAWEGFADQISDQLSDMILDWEFDLDGIRDIFGDLAKKLFLKPFLETAAGGFGNFLQGLVGAIGAPGRKHGGSTFAGATYWVGENGPELFTAAQSGRIYSARESKQMVAAGSEGGGGGRRGAVYMTVTTPDADSFRKSKRQVTGDLKRGVNFG